MSVTLGRARTREWVISAVREVSTHVSIADGSRTEVAGPLRWTLDGLFVRDDDRIVTAIMTGRRDAFGQAPHLQLAGGGYLLSGIMLSEAEAREIVSGADPAVVLTRSRVRLEIVANGDQA